MSKWEIAKQFDFCYGHRVYNQELDKEFAIDDCLCCRRLHGHQGKVIVNLEGDSLTRGMVVDFKYLNFLKKFIDDVLDHKFIIGKDDPNFEQIITKPSSWEPLGDADLVTDMWPLENAWCNTGIEKRKDYSTSYRQVVRAMEHEVPSHIWEHLESFVIVDFVPTSENLSKWLCEVAQEKMNKLGIKVSKVQFFETPKSQSNYFA